VAREIAVCAFPLEVVVDPKVTADPMLEYDPLPTAYCHSPVVGPELDRRALYASMDDSERFEEASVEMVK
jgi:hypothetical protein